MFHNSLFGDETTRYINLWSGRNKDFCEETSAGNDRLMELFNENS